MSSPSSSAAAVFETGKYSTTHTSVDSTSELPLHPPKPLLIYSPTEEGEFPVLILLHGYLLKNSFYSQLLDHIASHGFIAVAPQLYEFSCPDCTADIRSTAEITNWLPAGLAAVLPPKVRGDLAKLALSGHSRGGKTAFVAALKKASITTSIPFKALIGIDPVDGLCKSCRTPPPVLTYNKSTPFDIDMPIMVIGTGLGEAWKGPLMPPCAPKGVNHREFYEECKPPVCHFVAKDYGHMDMLDDETDGIKGLMSHCTCKNGESRGPMRRFCGGIVVAFLRAVLGGDSTDLFAVRDNPEIAPVEIQTEFRFDA